MALDKSNDIKDTAQLLIVIRPIDLNFGVTKELASLESMEGTTAGEKIMTSSQMTHHKTGHFVK